MMRQTLAATLLMGLILAGCDEDPKTGDVFDPEVSSDTGGGFDVGIDVFNDVPTDIPQDGTTPDVPGQDATDANSHETIGVDSGGVDIGTDTGMDIQTDDGVVSVCTAAPSSSFDTLDFFLGSDSLHYFGRSAEPLAGQFYDMISIEFFYRFGASDQTSDYQPFQFSGEDYSTCSTCGLAYRNCEGNGGGNPNNAVRNCEKYFLIQDGDLTVSSLGRSGEQLTFSLTGATFTEVTIDFDTFVTTPVADAETFCLDPMNVDMRIRPYCGDGRQDPNIGEECDDGAANSDTVADACRTTCKLPTCGDGIQDSNEGCDLGRSNGQPNSGCTALCRVPSVSCGDGILDPGEDCDDGVNNSDTDPDACRNDCSLPRCGDGVTDSTESCDEGSNNGRTHYYCSPRCNPCTHDDNPTTAADAIHAFDATDGNPDRVFYTTRTANPPNLRQLFDIQLYYDFNAPDTTAGYSPFIFTGQDYKDCVVCSLGFRGCLGSPPNVVCDKTFLIKSGELTLTSIGRTGDTMQGTLDKPFYELVTIAPAPSFSATIVDDNNDGVADETWCFDKHTIGPQVIKVAK